MENRHGTKCKFGRGSKCGMWQSPCWLDCSPEAWPPRQRMNRESWSLPWETYSAEPTSVRNPPMDLKSPRGLCPTGVYRTRRPRSPGWSRAPGTRVSAEPRLSLTRQNYTEKYLPLRAEKATTTLVPHHRNTIWGGFLGFCQMNPLFAFPVFRINTLV